MKQKQRIGMCMILLLYLMLLPVDSVTASDVTYYVSGDIGNDSNSGTKDSPVKTLNKAIELAETGSTIQVLDNVIIEDVYSNDAPYMIDKGITIKGNADNSPIISVHAGGIILGADVTFQDLKIGAASFLRPGIAANGYTLNLVNVHQDASLRPLQIYGGTFYDYSDTGVGTGIDYGSENRGSSSNINIIGGSFEAVYAGSVNGSFAQPVSISVAKGNGLTMEGIYAGTTCKNPSDMSTAGKIPVLDESVSLTSAVSVTVNDNAMVKIVDGISETHKVDLTVGGTGTYSYTVKNVDSLTVESGTFALTEESSFGNTGSNDPNVILEGSETNKATIDLSECVPYDNGSIYGICVTNFIGSSNGILVLNGEHTLVVNGTLSGGPTELRTSGGMPWSSAENPGYSGWMEYNTTYISSENGDGTFAIANPYSTQTDIAFTEDSSAENGWTTAEESLLEAPELIDFTPVSQTVSYADANTAVAGYNEKVNIDVIAIFSDKTKDQFLDYLYYVPLDYKIKYTDMSGTITEYIQQSSTLYDDYYYQCNYTTSTESVASTDVLMKLESMNGSTINICKGDRNLAAGTYEITIAAMTTTGLVAKAFTLTVLPEGDNAPASTITDFAIPIEEEMSYGQSITLDALVQDSDSASIGTGKVQLYINGEEYGEAVEVSEAAEWENVFITVENGFQIGNNDLTAVYLGTNHYASSVAEPVSVTVTKSNSVISYSGEDVAIRMNYDGKEHSFTPLDNTVSIQGRNNETLTENPVLGDDYVIFYTTGSQEDGSLVRYGAVNLPGQYTVWMKTIGNEYWNESTEIDIGEIVIDSVIPTVIGNCSDIEYIQSNNTITASGTIYVDVAGVVNGLVPEGTITVTMLHNEDDTDALVIETSDNVLVNGKAAIRFSNVGVDYLGNITCSYTPALEAPYDIASGFIHLNYVVVDTVESIDYTINDINSNLLYFAPEQTVTVDAGTCSGKEFSSWEFLNEEDGWTIPAVEGTQVSPVTFTMPGGNVSFSATWLSYYNVTLSAGEGYTVTSECGNTFSILQNDSYSFTVTLKDGYKADDGFVVKVLEGACETELIPTEYDETAGVYTYTVTEIADNQYITVEGVAQVFTVTYDANGGIGEDILPEILEKGAMVTVADMGDITRRGYIFTGWNTKQDGSGTTYNVGDTFSLKADTTLYAQWQRLSADASVQSVSVGGVSGVINGTTIIVELPYTTAAFPTDLESIEIMISDRATVCDLVTEDNGATWTFTVVAEDTMSAIGYMIKVSIAENPAADNEKDIADVKQAIENYDWTVDQNEANSNEDIKIWIERQLDKLIVDEMNYEVEATVTFATAGDEATPDGINGSFEFTVYLSKGNIADNTYAEDAVAINTGVITATDYIAPEPSYAIIYTDGLEKEEVFDDQKYTMLSLGDNTPVFNGIPAREGYEFMGWNPEVALTVSGNTTYTAMWQIKSSEPVQPDHSHQWETVWNKDDVYHWHECSVSGCTITDNNQKDGYENHHGGVASCISGVVCSDCGEEYGSVDSNSHRGGVASCISGAICSDCGEEYESVDSNNHIGGIEIRDVVDATAEQDGYSGDTYCLGCDTKIRTGMVIPATGNTHICNFNSVWKSDSMSHWKVCSCGMTDFKAVHSYGEWEVIEEATATQTGNRKRICLVCNYEQMEVIPATGQDDSIGENTPPEQDDNTGENTSPEQDNNTGENTPPEQDNNTGENTPPDHHNNGDATDNENMKPLEVGESILDSQTQAIYVATQIENASGTVEYVKPQDNAVKKVVVPDTIQVNGVTYKVASIAKSAFKNNKKLTMVKIGGNVKTIGANAFYGCKTLKTVTLGKYITTIGNNAFYKCTNLTKVTIPSNVSKIGKQAFYGCKKLKAITIKTNKLSKSKVGKNAFKGIHSKATMKVPKKKLKAYKSMLKAKGAGKKVTIKKL